MTPNPSRCVPYSGLTIELTSRCRQLTTLCRQNPSVDHLGLGHQLDEQRARRLTLQPSLVRPAGCGGVNTEDAQPPSPVGAAGPRCHHDAGDDVPAKAGDGFHADVDVVERGCGPGHLAIVRGKHSPAETRAILDPINVLQGPAWATTAGRDIDRDPGRCHKSSLVQWRLDNRSAHRLAHLDDTTVALK